MANFVGVDVSQRTCSVCVVDADGRRVWRGSCATDPAVIERTVRRRAGDGARVGMETGPMTPWLVHQLRGLGLDVVCLDARHARAALKLQVNKTDRNDAEGLAHVVRTGWFRAVHVKSPAAHRVRAVLGARAQLVGMVTRLGNQVRGVLKTFGLLPGAMRGLRFDRRVEELVGDRPDVAVVVLPLLEAWRQLRAQVAAYDKVLRAEARQDPTCRRLMTVPGIGTLTVLSYVSAVEDPGRFAKSRDVGAHLGLTPRRHQSGEVDRAGRISKCGDELVRTMMYEAAVVVLTRVKRASGLRDWAHAVARRSGWAKARVALARKISVILHSLWRSGEVFRWAEPAPAAT